MVRLYWGIGADIARRMRENGWGAKVVDRLAADLRREFTTTQGFSPRNLCYMRSFAEAWPGETFLQEALATITWYHNIALLEKLGTPAERLWYARQAAETGLRLADRDCALAFFRRGKTWERSSVGPT